MQFPSVGLQCIIHLRAISSEYHTACCKSSSDSFNCIVAGDTCKTGRDWLSCPTNLNSPPSSSDIQPRLNANSNKWFSILQSICAARSSFAVWISQSAFLRNRCKRASSRMTSTKWSNCCISNREFSWYWAIDSVRNWRTCEILLFLSMSSVKGR